MSNDPRATGEAAEETAALRSPVARRQRWAMTIAIVCAVVSTGGLIASSFVKSPAQLAAETEAPPETRLTAVVERRVLQQTLVVRGTVTAGRQVSVVPRSSSPEVAIQVVTGLKTKVGDAVDAGDVLLEVSGRPLIAVQGAVPFYRDLRPGDDGNDVGQLQRALRALGHYRGGDRKGYFGGNTKTAVDRLYRSHGYRTPSTGGTNDADERKMLKTQRDQVDQLKQQLAAGGQLPEKEKQALRRQLAAARAELAELIGRTGPMIPLAEVIVVPSFPGRVTEVAGKVGDTVSEKLISVAAGNLQVLAKLQPDQGELLTTGLKAELVAERLTGTATGTVSAVGEVTVDAAAANPQQDGGASGPYVPVTIKAAKPLPPAWFGQDVRVTIASAQTPEPVFVVPLSAVTSAADGRTSVSKVSETGAVARVDVWAGAVGDGYVEVDAADGALEEGDVVVVGK